MKQKCFRIFSKMVLQENATRTRTGACWWRREGKTEAAVERVTQGPAALAVPRAVLVLVLVGRQLCPGIAGELSLLRVMHRRAVSAATSPSPGCPFTWLGPQHGGSSHASLRLRLAPPPLAADTCPPYPEATPNNECTPSMLHQDSVCPIPTPPPGHLDTPSPPAWGLPRCELSLRPWQLQDTDRIHLCPCIPAVTVL